MKEKRKRKRKTKIVILLISLISIVLILSLYLYNRNNEKNNKKISNLEAQIGYLSNGIIYPFEEGKKFNNDVPIVLAWDIDEEGKIIFNKKEKKLKKDEALTEPGIYTIKVGKTSKKFEIIEDNIGRYITFDQKNKKVTINNIDDIINIKIGTEKFTKEEGNIPSSYVFTSKGRYDITLETVTGKLISNAYRI